MHSSLYDILLTDSVMARQLVGFLEQGGFVLAVIMLVTFFLWSLIIERLHYLLFKNRQVCDAVVRRWMLRTERSSWNAEKIRLRFISLIRLQAERRLSTIKLVVVVSPLLGLLGTVVGMIDVFDVMAASGAGNARAMSAGVSKATIPTMAGMVVSLSGLLFSVLLRRRAEASIKALAFRLNRD